MFCFRPFSDALVQVKLCSVGYAEFDILAQKFFVLYNTCKEQLSAQKHYDWGLRNILAVSCYGYGGLFKTVAEACFGKGKTKLFLGQAQSLQTLPISRTLCLLENPTAFEKKKNEQLTQ